MSLQAQDKRIANIVLGDSERKGACLPKLQ
jgi:hypothetical protein